MTVTMSEGNMNPPKKTHASKKNKKSWRKNTDIADIEEFLHEKRFDERVGGSFEDRPDADLFIVDKTKKGPKTKKNNRKDPKPLKCFANLLGLPGANDPIKKRNRTKLPEERVNPVVKDIQTKAIKAGKVKKKKMEATRARMAEAKRKQETLLDRTTRRRTKFDFDLWGSGEQGEVEKDEWVAEETKVHTMKNSGKLVPRAAEARASDTTGTLCPAVEIPHAGQSYNPSLGDHQQLLWKAAIVEMDKEKELARIERGTTMMFPGGEYKQEETYIQEMSEGIKELEKEEDQSEEEVENEEEEEEDEVKCQKLVGRKRRRDRRARLFEENKKRREMEIKKEEQEVMRLKSIKKELKVDDKVTEERKKKKEEADVEKRKGAIQLSNYKFENQDLEIKLSDELTGNLRNLKSEGSLLEDRYKSMQKRNVIETRVPQKIVKKAHKRKKFEKKSYKMGWEPKGYTPFEKIPKTDA